MPPTISGYPTIKTEFNLSEEEEEDSNSSNSPRNMVETTQSPLIKVRAISPNPRLSPQSHKFLNTKMLLTPQNLSYFESKFHRNNHLSENRKVISENMCKAERHLNGTTNSSSLFTIDSILSKQSRYSAERSPSLSPVNDNLYCKNDAVSPNRSRLPSALFAQHHPAAAAANLHITHLASNFGSPEFLGKNPFECIA
jgi:hypothetical protein